jgi:hypothetical protein
VKRAKYFLWCLFIYCSFIRFSAISAFLSINTFLRKLWICAKLALRFSHRYCLVESSCCFRFLLSAKRTMFDFSWPSYASIWIIDMLYDCTMMGKKLLWIEYYRFGASKINIDTSQLMGIEPESEWPFCNLIVEKNVDHSSSTRSIRM